MKTRDELSVVTSSEGSTTVITGIFETLSPLYSSKS